MKNQIIFVLANPADPRMATLRQQLADVKIIIGNFAEAFEKDAAEATVLYNWMSPSALFQNVFKMCSNLVWVHSLSAGLDKVMFPELVASRLQLTNGTGVFSAALGEFAIGAILYFAKDLRRMIRNQIADKWEPFDVLRVAGQTVGIFGYGDIGRAIASRARAMGMTVFAVKRHLPSAGNLDDFAEQIYTPENRIEMIRRCDYLAVSAPLTAETRGAIGKAEFAAMRSSAVVINVGRGPVIDETAMLEALSNDRIKGAALDVFDHEPLPPGHPFYKLENVLLSPHCADHTPDWLDNAVQFFIEQFERFRKGEPLLNVVDKTLGY